MDDPLWCSYADRDLHRRPTRRLAQFLTRCICRQQGGSPPPAEDDSKILWRRSCSPYKRPVRQGQTVVKANLSRRGTTRRQMLLGAGWWAGTRAFFHCSIGTGFAGISVIPLAQSIKLELPEQELGDSGGGREKVRGWRTHRRAKSLPLPWAAGALQLITEPHVSISPAILRVRAWEMFAWLISRFLTTGPTSRKQNTQRIY